MPWSVSSGTTRRRRLDSGAKTGASPPVVSTETAWPLRPFGAEAAFAGRPFAALAEGGQPLLAPEDMFWGARYAQVIDAFGIGWTLHCMLT